MPGTTAQGYPYATPSDPLVQWPATSQQLAEKIDALDIREAADAAKTSGVLGYTPAWTQDGGNALSIGNGTLAGRYARSGSIVTGHIVLTRGSTTNQGSAGYLFSLPPVAPYAFQGLSGSGVILQQAGGLIIPVIVQPVTASVMRLVRTTDGGRVSNTIPGAWAAGDVMAFSFTYLTNAPTALLAAAEYAAAAEELVEDAPAA